MELFAYIDPGTGSLFLQAVIGAALAGGVIFRNFIKSIPGRIKGLFSRKSNAPQDEEAS